MPPPTPTTAEIARFRALLGVSPKSTPAEIEAAYRRCAKQHHPDVGGDHAKMVDINNAHDWLRESAVAPAPPPGAPQAANVAAAVAAAWELARRQQAREAAVRAAAQKAAAEDLASRESVWGPRYQTRGAKMRQMPLSSSSGTAYGPRPQMLPPPPPPAQGKKRSRASQSIGASVPALKRFKETAAGPAAAKKASTTKVESTPDPVDTIFAAVKWDQPCTNAVVKKQEPEFVAWLEDESAWNWHMCYSEKDGFKLMGSERDGQIFLWKFCCATGAISMAVAKV